MAPKRSKRIFLSSQETKNQNGGQPEDKVATAGDTGEKMMHLDLLLDGCLLPRNLRPVREILKSISSGVDEMGLGWGRSPGRRPKHRAGIGLRPLLLGCDGTALFVLRAHQHRVV